MIQVAKYMLKLTILQLIKFLFEEWGLCIPDRNYIRVRSMLTMYREVKSEESLLADIDDPSAERWMNPPTYFAVNNVTLHFVEKCWI